MKASDFIESKYLRAAELKGRTVRQTISYTDSEDFDNGKKAVVFFNGAKKGLVLNATNLRVLADAYGDDMEGWAGKEVELYPTAVSFQGRTVDALRVRVPAPATDEDPNDALDL